MEFKELQYRELGERIIRLLSKENQIPSKELVDIGKEFSDFAGKEPRELTKCLAAEFGVSTQLTLIQWLATQEHFRTFHTKAIKLQSTDASCIASFYSNLSEEYLEECYENKIYFPFYVQDASGHFDKFVVLDNLYSFANGAGLKLLQSAQALGLPILIQAGYTFSAEYERAAQENDWFVLDHLIDYYKHAGFEDVNDRIGNYEDSVIMLYDSGEMSIF